MTELRQDAEFLKSGSADFVYAEFATWVLLHGYVFCRRYLEACEPFHAEFAVGADGELQITQYGPINEPVEPERVVQLSRAGW
jgi:hypothetical protein